MSDSLFLGQTWLPSVAYPPPCYQSRGGQSMLSALSLALQVCPSSLGHWPWLAPSSADTDIPLCVRVSGACSNMLRGLYASPSVCSVPSMYFWGAQACLPAFLLLHEGIWDSVRRTSHLTASTFRYLGCRDRSLLADGTQRTSVKLHWVTTSSNALHYVSSSE